MKKKILIAAICVVVCIAAGIGVYAATNYGSQEDPLVAKSYIDEVILPELEEMMDSQLDSAIAALNEKNSTDGVFKSVNLSSGQKLSCGAGTEFLVTSGSAKASGELVNTTAGTTVSSGSSLTANNLYVVTAAGGGVTASGSLTVLVNGSYSVG